MAKGEPKVCKIDEFTYDDLVEMVSNLDDLLGDMKGKYKSLRKKHVSLQESYEDLKTSHKIFWILMRGLRKLITLISPKKPTK
jgi:hypothetical protein